MNKGSVVLVVIIGAAIVLGVILLPKLTGKNLNLDSMKQAAPVQSMIPAPMGDVVLTLDPAQVDTSANKTFTVDVKIDTKSETVSATELHLSFDPDYLDATAIKESSFLPAVLAAGKVESGAASIILGSGPTAPKKGEGIIAKVTFKAKKAGVTKIAIAQKSQVAALGKTGDVLSTRGETSVNIK